MAKIGFLGLGIMGRAMATRLVDAGERVMVYNRTTERCAPLVELGAEQGATPAEVVAACDLTLACVSDPDAALDLCFADGGVLEAMGDGKGYVDLSTVDPETAIVIGGAVEASGGRFLEAPVSGSKKPAEDGTLVILAAGNQSLLTEATPLLDVLGKKTVYLGETGNGAAMKLVVNQVMGSMMTALCEAMALSRSVGLDDDDLLDVLDAGAMANPLFRLKGAAIRDGRFDVNFPLKHQQKDLRLALALADELGLGMPTAAATNESFKVARGLGAGDEDVCAVARGFGLDGDE